MKTLEILKARKVEVETQLAAFGDLKKELQILNRAIGDYSHVKPQETTLDGNMSLHEAWRLGIISKRMLTAIINYDLWFPDKTTKEITLKQLAWRSGEMPDPECLKTPNLGRKSLRELRDLEKRLSTSSTSPITD